MTRVAETGSTNADLVAAAHRGAPDATVLVADHQTAGRGRLDRQWLAPPGSSLLVSILLRSIPHQWWHRATMAVSVAAAAACETVAGVRPELKWPNDLYAADRKLAGVLAQSQVDQHTGAPFVVVGLGLNVNWPEPLPPEIADRAISLDRVCGHVVDRDQLLDALLDRLAATEWERVVAEYRAHLVTLGRSVSIVLPTGATVSGTAVDLDDDGALVLDDGTVITAGDLS